MVRLIALFLSTLALTASAAKPLRPTAHRARKAIQRPIEEQPLLTDFVFKCYAPKTRSVYYVVENRSDSDAPRLRLIIAKDGVRLLAKDVIRPPEDSPIASIPSYQAPYEVHYHKRAGTEDSTLGRFVIDSIVSDERELEGLLCWNKIGNPIAYGDSESHRPRLERFISLFLDACRTNDRKAEKVSASLKRFIRSSYENEPASRNIYVARIMAGLQILEPEEIAKVQRQLSARDREFLARIAYPLLDPYSRHLALAIEGLKIRQLPGAPDYDPNFDALFQSHGQNALVVGIERFVSSPSYSDKEKRQLFMRTLRPLLRQLPQQNIKELEPRFSSPAKGIFREALGA